jgi:dihydroorotase/N-acyl-D-amino-acid deacylase
MKAMVAEAMRDGALGISTGLFYVPGSFTPTEEVVELSKVAAQYGGIYISHMREEANQLLDSVSETIAIGEQAGIPVQITHHKVIGVQNWGASVDSLQLVDEGPRPRSRCHARSIPLHRVANEHQRPYPAVGAGRRSRKNA